MTRPPRWPGDEGALVAVRGGAVQVEAVLAVKAGG